MKNVLDFELQQFLRDILPEKTKLMQEIEEYAAQKHVSIVDQEVANFLKIIVAVSGSQKILEIGTGLGYSTIHLAAGLSETGKIITIEKSQERVQKAAYFINQSGFAEKITQIHGDARDAVIKLETTFDCIFLDAAKGQYARFLETFDTLLESGGIIIADNVLINGWVVDMNIPERRKRTMVVNMRQFLEQFKENRMYDMSLLPLGDGVALIRKR